MKKQTKSSQSGSMDLILIVVLVVLLVGVVGYYVYQRYNKSNTPASTNKTQPMVMNHPGVVQSLQFGMNLDPKSTVLRNVGTNFKQTDGTIYVVATLKNAKKDTRIEYVRYRDDFMVDNGGVTVKDGTQRVSFGFGLKPNGTHPKGAYKVKLYTNGVFETSGAYTIQ